MGIVLAPCMASSSSGSHAGAMDNRMLGVNDFWLRLPIVLLALLIPRKEVLSKVAVRVSSRVWHVVCGPHSCRPSSNHPHQLPSPVRSLSPEPFESWGMHGRAQREHNVAHPAQCGTSGTQVRRNRHGGGTRAAPCLRGC